MPQWLDYGEAVEYMLNQHLTGVAHRRQVVGAIPALHLRYISQQGLHLTRASLHP
ncbi:hypothetical protein D9M72_649670 [compost metagenome]